MDIDLMPISFIHFNSSLEALIGTASHKVSQDKQFFCLPSLDTATWWLEVKRIPEEEKNWNNVLVTLMKWINA